MSYVKAKSLSGVKAEIVCDQALVVVVVVDSPAIDFQFGAESWTYIFTICRRAVKFTMTRPMPEA